MDKLVPEPFLTNQNWTHLWITVWNYIQLISILCLSKGLPRYIESKVLDTCFYLIQNAFKKDWRKRFLTLYYISCPNFTIWLTLLLKILGNMFIVIICFKVFNKAKKKFFLEGESKTLRPTKSNFTIIWINIIELIDICRVIVNFMNSQYSRFSEHFQSTYILGSSKSTNNLLSACYT